MQVTLVERKNGVVRIKQIAAHAILGLQDYRYLEGDSPQNPLVKACQHPEEALPVLSDQGMVVVDFDTQTVLDGQLSESIHWFFVADVRPTGRFAAAYRSQCFEYAFQKGALSNLLLSNYELRELRPIPQDLFKGPLEGLFEWQDKKLKELLNSKPLDSAHIYSHFEYAPPHWSYSALNLESKDDWVALGKYLLDLDIDLSPHVPVWASHVLDLDIHLKKDIHDELTFLVREKFNKHIPAAIGSSSRKTL